VTENRIFFKDNPYPLGHVIKEFVWSGRLNEDGEFYFDFHLKTDNYYAEDPTHFSEEDPTEEELDADSWHSKIVWGNYHTCTMSSTYWGNDGFLIDPAKPKLNFANWPNTRLTADIFPPSTLNVNPVMPADMEWDELALHIYLLGHDACANHEMDITQNGATFNIAWTGKIALAYAGEDEFEYDFSANIADVKFDGFAYPQTMSQAQARESFAKIIANLDDFEFVDLNPKSNKREYKFALK
jgi:hypothetical protein